MTLKSWQKPRPDRDKQVVKLKEKGKTYTFIGKELKISRQRAWQIYDIYIKNKTK